MIQIIESKLCWNRYFIMDQFEQELFLLRFELFKFPRCGSINYSLGIWNSQKHYMGVKITSGFVGWLLVEKLDLSNARCALSIL